jgi:hypothetical protein
MGHEDEIFYPHGNVAFAEQFEVTGKACTANAITSKTKTMHCYGRATFQCSWDTLTDITPNYLTCIKSMLHLVS